MRRVLRSQILADDQWETFDLSGPIVHIATRAEACVEIWWIDDPVLPLRERTFRVFGTGHPLPDDAAKHVGTAVTPSGQLVWHLFERRPA